MNLEQTTTLSHIDLFNIPNIRTYIPEAIQPTQTITYSNSIKSFDDILSECLIKFDKSLRILSDM